MPNRSIRSANVAPTAIPAFALVERLLEWDVRGAPLEVAECVLDLVELVDMDVDVALVEVVGAVFEAVSTTRSIMINRRA